MNYNPKHVASYYNDIGIKEWKRFEKSPLEEIKLHIHNQFLRRFVIPGNKVLEIGAGPGRFTMLLAELGANIIVTDISSAQLELNKQKSQEHNFFDSVLEWKIVDITDLSAFTNNEFDLILAYGGPLSYVFNQCTTAIGNCYQKLKSGGFFVASVMSLWGTVHRSLEGVLEIEKSQNDIIMQTGNLTPDTLPNRKHYAHMFRANEIKQLFIENGFKIEAVSASNSISTNKDNFLADIRDNEKKWNDLLNYEEKSCYEPGMLDTGTHILICGRKNKKAP